MPVTTYDDLLAMLAQGDARILPDPGTALTAVRQGQDYTVYAAVCTPAQLPIELELALELQTEGNTRVHWRTASQRAKAQRLGVYHALCRYGSAHALTGPLTITLTRIAPRPLGHTNIASACKHLVDGITDWLTSKPGKGHYYDDDPRFTWTPQQQRGRPGEYAVHIRIEATTL
jgi:hypothetical protein